MAYSTRSSRRPMATLALGLPSLFTSRWRIASWGASHWHKVMAAWHNAQRSVTEPALVMLPLWVRPADSFMSAVRPAQNSKVSALGKRSKGPTSAAIVAAQISPMPGTLVSSRMIGATARCEWRR